MKKALTKRRLNWEPIKNPVLQNTIVGFVLGIMLGINLKAFYTRIHGPAIVWISIFVIGVAIGFLSGLERKKMMKKKEEKKAR